MDDDFFSELNDIIDKWFSNEENCAYFDDLKNIVCLALLVIENTPDLSDRRVLKDHIDINDTINLVIDFFKSINPEYAYRLQNIINEEKNIYNGVEDYSVKFCRIYDFKNGRHNSGVEYDGRVRIDYDNTIADAVSLAHEMTHKLSAPYMQSNLIKRFLGEASSIQIEFLLYDYLTNNELYKKDINSRMLDRFLSVYNSSCNVLFEYTLLKLYVDNDRYISKQIFMDYLNSMDRSSKLFKIFIEIAHERLWLIYKTRRLHFIVFQRYVIGLVLACDFHKRLKSDKDVINELFKLIDILGKGHTSLDDVKVLHEFIPIIENDDFRFDIDDDILDRLTEAYKSELGEVLNKRNDLENNNASKSK